MLGASRHILSAIHGIFKFVNYGYVGMHFKRYTLRQLKTQTYMHKFNTMYIIL